VSRFVHDVERALRAAGDADRLHVWRRTCRELASGPRVAVIARSTAEATAALPALGGLGALALGLDSDEPLLPPALRDALLGAHAIVWATAATQPLGARERASLGAVEAAVHGEDAPPRVVLVRGAATLAHLADDPAAERAAIAARIAALVPEGWSVTFDDAPLPEALAALRSRHEASTEARTRAAARHLLDDAARHVDDAIHQAEAAVARADAARAAEDDALDAARAAGRRAAAATLAVATRHTETLRIALRTFLIDLEGDLADQIRAVPDAGDARRALPAWIEHVVLDFLTARLDAWRRDVAHDLDGLPASDAALAHAELLLPPVHPAPLPQDGRWRRAVGVTAGVGGAALLAAFQLWIPAVLAAGGAVAWSALDRDPDDVTRDRLTERARAAVREVAADTDRVLADQLDALRTALADLGEAEARRVATERADVREALLARRRLHDARLHQAREAREAFVHARSAL
jgi:hypothetical protein